MEWVGAPSPESYLHFKVARGRTSQQRLQKLLEPLPCTPHSISSILWLSCCLQERLAAVMSVRSSRQQHSLLRLQPLATLQLRAALSCHLGSHQQKERHADKRGKAPGQLAPDKGGEAPGRPNPAPPPPAEIALSWEGAWAETAFRTERPWVLSPGPPSLPPSITFSHLPISQLWGM